MKSIVRTTTLIGSVLMLTACAGIKPWTAEERARLTPISVVKTQTPENAFYDISIKSYQMTRYTTGLTERRGLIAAAVDISDAVQQGKFNDRYKPLLTPIKQTSQAGLEDTIMAKLKSELENIPTFSGKVKDDASTKIELQIRDTGFIRAGNDKGSTSAVEGLPLAFGARGLLTITDARNKPLLNTWVNAQSKTIGDVPALVVNDYELVNKMRNEVINGLIDQAKLKIQEKLISQK